MARNDAGTLRVQNQLTTSSGLRAATDAARQSRSGIIETLSRPMARRSRRVPSASRRQTPAQTIS